MRRSFLIFLSIAGILILAAIGFVQSARFAQIVKAVVAKNLPDDMGIDGDFSEFRVRFFPPGISIIGPKVTLREGNVINLPGGSKVTAERIDLKFYPLQMLSGNVRVHEASIVAGDIDLKIDAQALAGNGKEKKKGGFGLNWDELFQIRAEAVSFENTRVKVEFEKPALSARFLARALRVGQWSGRGGLGYEISADLAEIQAEFPKDWAIPRAMTLLQAELKVNALGAQLDHLSVDAPGMSVQGKGQIDGNVLNPKDLPVKAEVTAEGDLPLLAGALGIRDWPAKLGGRVKFAGSLDADLQRFAQTASAKGKLEGKGVKVLAWEFDRFSAQGEWRGPDRLEVDHVEVESAQAPRLAGGKPARGGSLEAGPFKLSLSGGEPVVIPLKVTDAHIHWLAAAGLEDVFALDFRATGPIGVTYSPRTAERPWQVRADLDLGIPAFQFDNQRLNKDRPLKKILDFDDLRLAGSVVVLPTEIRPEGLQLKFPDTELEVGGKIDFAQGYDLRATGGVNMADFGTIAENEIRGTGSIAAQIHGPSSHVLLDFDVDLREAYYLKLRLGDLKGRITFDDGTQEIHFSKMVVDKGRTRYAGDGRLELRGEETIRMDLEVPRGDIQDFIQIFQEQTAGLWWFPRTLTGEAKGTIRVRGMTSLDKLKVEAQLAGPNWDWIGERFAQVALVGGYDGGRYYLESLDALKHHGAVTGRISYSETAGIDWNVGTHGFRLSDFDRIARLDVPIRSDLAVSSSGSGKMGAISSNTSVALRNFVVRGVQTAPSEVLIRSSEGVLEVKSNMVGGQGVVDLSYDFKPGGRSYLRGDLRNFDFAPVLLLLNPSLMGDPALAARITSSVDLAFSSGQAALGTGKVEIADYLLAKTGARFELAGPVTAKLEAGSIDMNEAVLRGSTGEARVSLSARNSVLSGEILGDIDVSIAEFLTETVERSSAVLDLDFDLAGTLKEPEVSGRGLLRGGEVKLRPVDSPLQNMTGVLRLRQNVITAQNLRANLAGGRVSCNGTVQVFPDRYPALDLSVDISDSRLRIYPFTYALVSGGLVAKGDAPPYPVSGDVIVKEALSREKVFDARRSRALRSARYTPRPSAAQEADYPTFGLDVRVKADDGVLVKNDLFDAELKADLKLVNTIAAPRLLGTAEVLHGTISFKDQAFRIESSKIEFDNPAVINPKFDLTAATEVSGTGIRLHATGRVEDWTVNLSSNPALPETEILSLLALGLTTEDMRRLRTGDSAVLQQGEAASLVLDSLGVNEEMESQLGFQIGLDEAVDPQAGTSIFRPQAETDAAAAAPKIVIRRRIGKKVDITAGSTVGVGTGSQQEVNAEYKVKPWMSVIGVWNSREDPNTQGAETSYGVDLKFQKRFK